MLKRGGVGAGPERGHRKPLPGQGFDLRAQEQLGGRGFGRTRAEP